MKTIFIELTVSSIDNNELTVVVPIEQYLLEPRDTGTVLIFSQSPNFGGIQVKESPQEIMKKISDYVIFIKKEN